MNNAMFSIEQMKRNKTNEKKREKRKSLLSKIMEKKEVKKGKSCIFVGAIVKNGHVSLSSWPALVVFC